MLPTTRDLGNTADSTSQKQSTDNSTTKSNIILDVEEPIEHNSDRGSTEGDAEVEVVDGFGDHDRPQEVDDRGENGNTENTHRVHIWC